MDTRCAIEDKNLLNFVVEVSVTQLAQGRHFFHEHFEDAPTWGSPRMRALCEHPRCGVIPGDRGARWQEMRSSNGPTMDLSSAPELLSVLGSIVTHKSSSVPLFRETMRGVAAQRPNCKDAAHENYNGALQMNFWEVAAVSVSGEGTTRGSTATSVSARGSLDHLPPTPVQLRSKWASPGAAILLV